MGASTDRGTVSQSVNSPTGTGSPPGEASTDRDTESVSDRDLLHTGINNNNREPHGSQEQEPERQDGPKGRRAARAPEPPAFTALLEGVALRGKGRAFALAHWRDDPGLVEANVARWHDRLPYSKPGLLVEMLRFGDDPRLDADDF